MPIEETKTKKRRDSKQSAAFHRDQMERHARKAWLADNDDVREALKAGEVCRDIGERESLADEKYSKLAVALLDAHRYIKQHAEALISSGLKGSEART